MTSEPLNQYTEICRDAIKSSLLEYGWSIGYSHRSELHQQVG